MDDLISRRAAIDAIEKHLHNILGGTHFDKGVVFVYKMAHEHIKDVINTLPTIEAEDVKRGRWDAETIKDFGGNEYVYFTCSECNETSNDKFDYCPNCGAKMETEVDE